MVKSSAMGVGLAAAAVYGSYQASKVFVPSALGPRSATEGPALRGASEQLASYESQSSSSSSAPIGLLATGALGMMAVSTSRGSRTVRAAAAAAETEAPPPPPPFNPAKQFGASAPLGFFDPLGFSKVGDEEGFRRLRIAELKHGRVAMMASVGAVIQHYAHFPGFDGVPNGIWAVTSSTGAIGFGVLTVVSGALELVLWKDDNNDVENIGNFGNPAQMGIGPPLGAGEGMRTRELNNGRAAMFATVGIIVAELLTGKDGMQQLGFS